jgi:uncharacterized protein YukE
MASRRLGFIGFVLIAVSIGIPPVAFGQTQNSTATSLGELARQFRQQRANTGLTPVRVLTNDDLSPPLPQNRLNSDDSSSILRAEKVANHTSGASSVNQTLVNGHDEEYFHSKMQDLHKKLEADQQALRQVDQRIGDKGEVIDDYGQTSSSYHWKSLNPDELAAFDWWTDINMLRAKRFALKQSIADDRKAALDLEDECRREGCRPSWLR